MRIAAVGVVLVMACAPHVIEVRTAQPAADSSLPAIVVTNALTQAVNVYVTAGEVETFVRQVPPASTQRCPVPGVATGATVSFRAVTADRARAFAGPRGPLVGTMQFTIP